MFTVSLTVSRQENVKENKKKNKEKLIHLKIKKGNKFSFLENKNYRFL